jgi:hypothetical protein
MAYRFDCKGLGPDLGYRVYATHNTITLKYKTNKATIDLCYSGCSDTAAIATWIVYLAGFNPTHRESWLDCANRLLESNECDLEFWDKIARDVADSLNDQDNLTEDSFKGCMVAAYRASIYDCRIATWFEQD